RKILFAAPRLCCLGAKDRLAPGERQGGLAPLTVVRFASPRCRSGRESLTPKPSIHPRMRKCPPLAVEAGKERLDSLGENMRLGVAFAEPVGITGHGLHRLETSSQRLGTTRSHSAQPYCALR